MQINFARREIACKIVYYGPGMSGKTTNLEILHEKTPREHKGELTCIATEGDRTLFFDFMPLNLGNIRGMNTKFQLYTVPGQVYYNSTRKLVLRGVDGVIFVADSGKDKMEENLESLRNLEENLREYGRDVKDLPIVLQYNKRDRPDALSVDEINKKLNPRGVPCFEGVACEGQGVMDTLKCLAGLVIQNLDLQPPAGSEAAPTTAASDSGSRPAAPSSGSRPAASNGSSDSPAPSKAPAAAAVKARPKTSQRPAASTTTQRKAARPSTRTATRTKTAAKPAATTAKRKARPAPTTAKKKAMPAQSGGGSARLVLLSATLAVVAAGAAAWYFLI